MKTDLREMIGKIEYQEFFQQLYEIALKGMNVGSTAGRYDQSGEKYVLEYIYNIVKNRPATSVILDVGANVGAYAKQVLNVFGEKAQLHCFEPSKTAFAALSESLKAGNVHHHNYGFGSSGDCRELFTNHWGSGQASLFKRTNTTDLLNFREVIEIKRLDDWIVENKIDRITLLKMDIEGGELNVLKTIESVLSQSRIEYIQFEFSIGNMYARNYFSDFFQLLSPSYKIHRIVQNGLWEISEYNDSCELFVAANYLAVLKPR